MAIKKTKKAVRNIDQLNEDNLELSNWVDAGVEEFARVRARNESRREKKDAKFTARLNQGDFEKLKSVAEKKGLGYQTLLGSIIHQYVTGNLIAFDEVKKFLAKAPKAKAS